MEINALRTCSFCNPTQQIILFNAYAIALYDGFPVTPGHSLIIPKRHISSFFEATSEEQTACSTFWLK